MKAAFQGVLTTKEEFLFPDNVCGELPKTVTIPMPQNGKPALQLLLKTQDMQAKVSTKSETVHTELFCMKKVPVEYNTGDGQEQGGAMVILAQEKPSYAVKKAPFWVYDCLQPTEEGIVQAQDGQIAIYACFALKNQEQSGEHFVEMQVDTAEGSYCCRIVLNVYAVKIPQESFAVTNWYSLDAMERMHNVKKGSAEFDAVLKEHIRAMRRVRQNTFFVQLDGQCVKDQSGWEFDFEYLHPEISAFFEGGMKTLEIGGLLSRGFLPNGKPDMYTDTFKCAVAPEIPLESAQGYEIVSKMVQELARFLKKYGWDKNVMMHIHDEPDVHYPDAHTLQERRRQYYMAVGIVKRYLPDCKIIEAVKTTEFRGCVDIWVPVTNEYEPKKTEFDRFAQMGEEVWTYVCCVPEGNWLNRFLDKPVLESRVLMWGCEKNRLSGYLHWGWNQFPQGMNPFEATSCYNPTGIGTNFPCGDAFIVYPGNKTNPVWLSMRLEAERRGTEDLELLRLLRQKNESLYRDLLTCVFRSNQDFEKNPNVFEKIYERLLKALE